METIPWAHLTDAAPRPTHRCCPQQSDTIAKMDLGYRGGRGELHLTIVGVLWCQVLAVWDGS